MSDPFKYFRIEARELLDRLNRDLIELEKKAAGQGLLERMRRDVHTLKGAARVVRQSEIASLAVSMEETLLSIQESTEPAPEPVVAKLARQLTEFAKKIVEMDGPAPRPESMPRLETVRLELSEVDRLLQRISETGIKLARLRRVTEARAALEARQETEALDQVEREFEQLRETAQRLRLVPANALFLPLERVAHDVARKDGKEVEFVATGGDVRIDGQVLSPLFEAFLHVVRNAVDHGIEAPQERVRLGKPRAGRISVGIRGEGYQVVISCTDDGRGIDLESVRDRARSAGLVPEQKLAGMTDQETAQLVLLPGLSTASKVSEISGRGIGLDVLNETVKKLNGEIRLRSSRGGGLVVEVKVPFSISSILALFTKAGEDTVVIPQYAIESVRQVEGIDITWADNESRMVCDGNVIRFIPLSAVLGQPVSAERLRKSWIVIIAKSAGVNIALGVDRVLGAREALIRPMPRTVPQVPGFIGTVLDLEGDPLLVFDPLAVTGALGGWREAARRAESAEVKEGPILVIDDSLTSRMLEQGVLESAGYQVQVAESAEAGLALARRHDYSMFVCDVEMPGMDGFEFVRRVRQDPKLQAIPAVIVSTRDSDEDKRRGMEVGAQAYIAKGKFDQKQFLRVIETLR